MTDQPEPPVDCCAKCGSPDITIWTRSFSFKKYVCNACKHIEHPPDHCDNCGSTNIVIWEKFFGWKKYSCTDCHHKATE